MAKATLPEDPYTFVPHAYANDLLPEPTWAERVGLDEKRLRKINKLTANTYHRMPNGAHDTMTILLVADVLMRSKPGIRLRSRYVAKQLQATRPMFIWDQQTVGRIMGHLAAKATDAYEAY